MNIVADPGRDLPYAILLLQTNKQVAKVAGASLLYGGKVHRCIHPSSQRGLPRLVQKQRRPTKIFGPFRSVEVDLVGNTNEELH